MLPLVIAAFGFWLLNLLDGTAQDYRDVAESYRMQVKEKRTQELASAVAERFRETGAYPANLTALATEAGREHLRSSLDTWQGYTLSGTINDGVWRFQRAAMYLEDPSAGVTPATYFAANTCGTGAASAATSWCGPTTGTWFRQESRQEYNQMLAKQRVRMNMTLQKIASHFNHYQSLPDQNFGGAALANGSITRMSALVNYTGAANNCSGTFVHMNTLPISCEDMFDIWGGQVGYQFESNRRIILVAETPMVNAGGTPVRIAAELDLTGL